LDHARGILQRALLAARPEAKRNEKILLALPAAAKQLRDQIKRGLSGDPVEAGRARIALRHVPGEEIVLKPSKDRMHLIAHLLLHRAALLGLQYMLQFKIGRGEAICAESVVPIEACVKPAKTGT
jgi:hypothetical protein